MAYRKENTQTISKMEQNKQDNIIGYDFQGWPVRKMTFREILLALGGKEENGKIIFDPTGQDSLLDTYPRTLEDDGMAYGVNPQYITEVEIYEGEVSFWLDKEHPYNPKEEEK